MRCGSTSSRQGPDPEPLLSVLRTLLGPEGCPWDREQSPESLCDYLTEEIFELVDAVRSGDSQHIREEMGDAFFLLFFMAMLLERRGGFDLQEVWESGAAKMVFRHPHVFGQARFSDREELKQSWEESKKQEQAAKNASVRADEPLRSIPASLPPLIRAYRIQAKAAKMGFTWPSDAEQERALEAEWAEWDRAKSGRLEEREEELGDVLFSLVEQGRRHGVKANAALHRANLKFLERFRALLRLVEARGLDWEALDLEAMNGLWEEVKSREGQP